MIVIDSVLILPPNFSTVSVDYFYNKKRPNILLLISTVLNQLPKKAVKLRTINNPLSITACEGPLRSHQSISETLY